MAGVFLSYARADREFVERLRDALAAAGWGVASDSDDVPPARELWDAVRGEILGRDAFVFVLSPDSVASQWCLAEVQTAQGLAKRLIPVLRRQVPDIGQIPESLARLNWIYFDDDDKFDRSLELLIEALETDLEWTMLHTGMLVRATAWAENGSDRSYLLRGTELRSAERWLDAASGHPSNPPTDLQVQYITASTRRRGTYEPRSGPPVPAPSGQPPDDLAGTPDESPAANVPEIAMSESATEAVRYAVMTAGGPTDASVLLLAALEYSHEHSLPGVTAQLLDGLLAAGGLASTSGGNPVGPFFERLNDVLKTERGESAKGDYLDQLQSPPLSPLVRRASALAAAVSGSSEVHLRHLVAVAVMSRSPALRPEFLDELHVTHPDLIDLLLTAVTSAPSSESVPAWEEALTAARDVLTQLNLAGGISSDRVDPALGIPLSQDHLDVAVWVSMMAAVVADPSTPMPLSVGIFGEWGSGKSYFMGLLRAEIERLAASGRQGYLSHVIQIGFNAWHYADTNLWASLGDEIFHQLAGPGESAVQIRTRLREVMSSKTAEQEDLEARAEHARTDTARLKSALTAARSERQDRAVGLLSAVRTDRDLHKRLNRVWHQLGIADEAERAQVLAGELAGHAEEPAVLRRALSRRRARTLAGLGIAAALGLAALAWAPASWAKWLGGGSLAAIFVAAGSALTFLGQMQSGLTSLRSLAADINRPRERRISDAVSAAADELHTAEAAEVVAQVQLDEVSERVKQLARELADLAPGQRLYKFLAERAASGQYAGQLGLISIIRKDFEQLVELLTESQTAGHGEPMPRPIDRIVLYIDDLDRCRPQQVVDVLQAVHLLLALDLFVVVVGVDPRWLRHSLQSQYKGILSDETTMSDGNARWNVDPDDYLEKIFNIPFVVPGIPAGGLGKMLRGLAGTATSRTGGRADDTPTVRSEGVAAASDESAEIEGPTAPVSAQRIQPSTSARIPIEQRSELAAIYTGDGDDPPRPLTDRELAFMTGLDAFVGTPREAKRMFNLYRMIRATRDLSDASAFLGDDSIVGEYQAVALLLAMMTFDVRLLRYTLFAESQPAVGALGGLTHRMDGESWSSFVAGLVPVKVLDLWGNQVVGSIAADDIAAWWRFADSAVQTSHLVSLPDLITFKRWAPRIERFSYVLAPLDKVWEPPQQ